MLRKDNVDLEESCFKGLLEINIFISFKHQKDDDEDVGFTIPQ